MIRYGCRWPDGSETGPISDHYRLALAYSRNHDGIVLDYHGEVGTPHEPRAGEPRANEEPGE